MQKFCDKEISAANRLRMLLLSLALVTLGGCAVSDNVQQIDSLESVAAHPRVVMMPPDIRYYLLTAGGVPQPHAEWTVAARENFAAAAAEYADLMGADMRILDANNIGQAEVDYERLHNVVGLTILDHHFGPSKLPSKAAGEIFDWSLGSEIRELADKHNADYALFVYYRDYQASGGRVAFSILAAAAGAYVPSGSEHGFATLVDLNTGNVVWFNRVAAGSGEMRDEQGAIAAVETLFRDIPTSPRVGTQ